MKKYILLIITLLILTSCNFTDLFNNKEESLSLDLKISLADRTIFSDFDAVISYYEITGENSDSSKTINTTISTTSDVVTGLTAEEWTFTVNACDSTDNVLATGSTTLTISTTEVNNASVFLDYTQVGTGDLAVTFEWPTNIRANRAEISWQSSTNDIDITGATSLLVEADTTTSGSSILSAVFYFEDTLMFSETQSVEIYDYQNTTETITKTSDEILPSVPTSFTSDYSDSYNVNLVWDTPDAEMVVVYIHDFTTSGEDTSTYTPTTEDLYTFVTLNDEYYNLGEYYSGNTSIDYLTYLFDTYGITDPTSSEYDAYFDEYFVVVNNDYSNYVDETYLPYDYATLYSYFYYVYYYEGLSYFYPDFYTNYDTPHDQSETDSETLSVWVYNSATGGNEYGFWIQAVNDKGVSDISDVLLVTTPVI